MQSVRGVLGDHHLFSMTDIYAYTALVQITLSTAERLRVHFAINGLMQV